jgi:DtxR family Mn-dependent transcriptional regulator
MPSSTVENYLKTIFHLSDKVELVAIGSIAKELELTPGTVTSMMKHLEQESYVDYVPRKGVKLTESGLSAALQVLRRHRLIELFLVEVMQLDWAHVHDEAEVLEHVLSDRMVERIDEMLGRPTCDPHGDPIPSADGVVSEEQSKPLDECAPGAYRLVRITRDEPEFLEWLQQCGLRPGAKLQLTQHDKVAGILEVKIQGSKQAFQVSDAVATSLRVQ